jgi:uncharacterized membrane protein
MTSVKTADEVVIDAEAHTGQPSIRRIGPDELRDALNKGIDDFIALPTYSIFLIVIYPVLGLLLFRLTFGYDFLPLIYPLVAGFALIGPLAMIGVYELSRRREEGLPVTWDAFNILKFPRLRAIMTFGLVLMAIFVAWLIAAMVLYQAYVGHATPRSVGAFVDLIVGTSAGTSLIFIGTGVGFIFATATFAISVVSVPMLLDRDVSVGVAISTSVNAVKANPTMMAVWGFIIVIALAGGSVPLFLGLAVVLPVLGHTTWHLYRKIVE